MARGRNPELYYKGKTASEWYKVAEKAMKAVSRVNDTAMWCKQIMTETETEPIADMPKKTKKTKK